MTMCRIYVGNLADPKFSWDEGDWNYNAPVALSPSFPPRSNSYFFADFFEWVKKKKVTHKQTDWGTTVARVTKAEILDFIAFCYDSDPSYNDPGKMLKWEGKAYLVKQLQLLKKSVAALDARRTYGLVVMEE